MVKYIIILTLCLMPLSIALAQESLGTLFTNYTNHAALESLPDFTKHHSIMVHVVMPVTIGQQHPSSPTASVFHSASISLDTAPPHSAIARKGSNPFARSGLIRYCKALPF